MGTEPEQSIRAKILFIGAIVGPICGVAALAVSFLGYVRPTDYAHPVHFDFLFSPVSFSLWVFVLGAIGVTVGAFLLGTKRSTKHIEVPENKPGGKVVRTVPTLPKLNPSITPVQQSIDDAEKKDVLTLESPDHFVVHIRRLEAQGTIGLMVKVDNNRLQPIQGVTIVINTAQSFDGRHQAFRDGYGFNPVRMTQSELVLPSTSGKDTWIIRKTPSSPHLFVGDDNTHLLIWPENDKAEVHDWRLSFAVIVQTKPKQNATDGAEFAKLETSLLLSWHPVGQDFHLEEEGS
jgi:hypothetical protein